MRVEEAEWNEEWLVTWRDWTGAQQREYRTWDRTKAKLGELKSKGSAQGITLRRRFVSEWERMELGRES